MVRILCAVILACTFYVVQQRDPFSQWQPFPFLEYTKREDALKAAHNLSKIFQFRKFDIICVDKDM